MNKRKIVIFLGVALVLIIMVLTVIDGRIDQQLEESEVVGEADKQMIGGVVPHHELVADEIDSFWSRFAAETDVELLVLVGPDHENKGQSPIVLADDQAVLSKRVVLAQELISEWSGQEKVSIDNGAFVDEHAIQIHLSYIAKEMPGVQLVPVLIRADAQQRDVLDLAGVIAKQNAYKNVAVVASVDFSHYQPREVADQNDRQSLTAIQSYDYNFLRTFGPDNIDSDQSVVLVSEAVCPSRNCEWSVWYHGNSADYNPAAAEFTTSYFSLYVE